MVLLRYHDELKAVLPDIVNTFLGHIPEMMEVIERHVSEHGTFYYDDEYPDLTESAPLTLAGFQLIDQHFLTHHESLQLKAMETIIRRQDVSGGFLGTARPAKTRLHGCDEVGSLTCDLLVGAQVQCRTPSSREATLR